MTYYLLFLICGFFAGLMFEKNRIVRKLMRDSESLRHELLKEVCNRLSGALLLQRRKHAFTGFLGSAIGLLGLLSTLLFVGCALPMGSPTGYTPILNSPTIEPVCFYIPPAAMSFTTGQWEAPDAFTEFKPRTPIPRPFFGQVGGQNFSGLQ